MARIMLVGPDLVAAHAVVAGPGYQAPDGFFAVASATAEVGDVLDPVAGGFLKPARSRADRAAALAREVEARKAAVAARGAPYAGRRVEVDDASRTNLGGMTIAATLSIALGAPWDAGYAEGWIAMDNTRIPLPSPQEAVALARSVGAWYAGLVQFARTAKDAVLAAADPDAAFAALDWTVFGEPAAGSPATAA